MLRAYLKYQMDLNTMTKKRAGAHNAAFSPSRTHTLSSLFLVFSVIEQNNTPLTTVAAAI